MKIHITNLYGVYGTGTRAQSVVTDIASGVLESNELGVYRYSMDSDSPEMLRTRLDGIIASVRPGDIVIFQFPTWNGIRFDEALIGRLKGYAGLKKVIFIQDVTPLMYEENLCLLDRYVNLYNQADLIIVPSQKMVDFLKTHGLKVSKFVVQRMWDFPVHVDKTVTPQFKKLIQFAGSVKNPNFAFVKEWKYRTVRLAVTADKGEWGVGKNIEFLGWFEDESVLSSVLRKNGGFGLLWTENRLCGEYMKLNACCKFSTYIGSGLPVIVHSSIPEADTVIEKNLGFVVDSLDEAVSKVEEMTPERYDQMACNAWKFGYLLREGYFAKKVLIDAVFKLLYD